jgi:hypothetical protein
VNRTALLFVVALGALRDPCGTDTTGAGVNGPCTRSTDCQPGLACLQGVCTSLEAGGADGGGADAGGADASDAGGRDGSGAD